MANKRKWWILDLGYGCVSVAVYETEASAKKIVLSSMRPADKGWPQDRKLVTKATEQYAKLLGPEAAK